MKVFAAIVSLLNDFRLSNGKPPLGFLNPLLYSSGVHGLTDITEGEYIRCCPSYPVLIFLYEQGQTPVATPLGETHPLQYIENNFD